MNNELDIMRKHLIKIKRYFLIIGTYYINLKLMMINMTKKLWRISNQQYLRQCMINLEIENNFIGRRENGT